jgi:hypothetical protein
VSEVARCYGIPRRVLCRWRQEQAAIVRFVDVAIVNASEAAEEVAPWQGREQAFLTEAKMRAGPV